MFCICEFLHWGMGEARFSMMGCSLSIALYRNVDSHFNKLGKKDSLKLGVINQPPKGYIQFVFEACNRAACFVDGTRPGNKVDPFHIFFNPGGHCHHSKVGYCPGIQEFTKPFIQKRDEQPFDKEGY